MRQGAVRLRGYALSIIRKTVDVINHAIHDGIRSVGGRESAATMLAAVRIVSDHVTPMYCAQRCVIQEGNLCCSRLLSNFIPAA